MGFDVRDFYSLFNKERPETFLGLLSQSSSKSDKDTVKDINAQDRSTSVCLRIGPNPLRTL